MGTGTEATLLCLLVTPVVLLVALAMHGITSADSVDTFLSCVEIDQVLKATCPIKQGVYTLNMKTHMHSQRMFVGKAARLVDIVSFAYFCDDTDLCGEEESNFSVDLEKMSVTVYRDVSAGEKLFNDVDTMLETFDAVQMVYDKLGIGGVAAKRVRSVYNIASIAREEERIREQQ